MLNQTNSSDKRLFYKLNISQRLLLKYVDRESTNKLDVPVIQTAALFYLMKNDGCLLKELSAALMQNKSATTTLAERMEKNGLIVKKNSETDGRALNLFLTDKGRDISNQAQSLMTEFNRELLEPFSKTEIKIIHGFLNTIIETYR